MKILTRNKFDENYKSCDKRRKVKFGRGIFFEKSSKKRRERERRDIESLVGDRVTLPAATAQPANVPRGPLDSWTEKVFKYLLPRFASIFLVFIQPVSSKVRFARIARLETRC